MKKQQRLLYFTTAFIAAFSFLYFYVRRMINVGGLWLVDIECYWRNAKLFIGLDENAGNIVPVWGKIFNALVYPPRWKLETVNIYFYILLLITIEILAYFLIMKIREDKCELNELHLVSFASFIIMMPFYWDDVINTGNIGGLLAVIAMIGILTIGKNEYVAGFLLAFAMVKPQLAAIFYLSLLIQRKWKVIISSIVTLGIATLLAILRTKIFIIANAADSLGVLVSGGNKASIIDEFKGIVLDYSSLSDKLDFFSYGICDWVRFLGFSPIVALFGSAIVGTVFVIALSFKLKKYPELFENDIIFYSIPALASTFWCYKTPCDEITVILCSFVAFYYWKYSDKDLKTTIEIIIYFACMNMKVIRCFAYNLFDMNYRVSIMGDWLLKIVVFIYFIFCLCKKYEVKTDSKVEK